MKVGILGDIHANLEALDAVLEELDRLGCTRFVSVGDLVGYGADPGEVITRLRMRNTIVVAGNHDHAVIGKLSIEFFNVYARESALWTRKNLGDEEKKFLHNLPLVHEEEKLTVAHSTLSAPELFEYIQTSYDAHLSFEHQKTAVCFVGHSHVPVNFVKRGRSVTYNTDKEVQLDGATRFLINVGAIGQPRDENPDAVACAFDTDEGIVRLRRVRYDIETAARKIKKAGLPEVLAERLKYGR